MTLSTSTREVSPRVSVSVVVPSFNQAGFIARTLQSIIDQDYPALEIIVIDGGSTDGSVDVIRNFEKHLAYWVSEPDRGQTHAINKGMARANGELRAYLNSDDVYLPGALHAVSDAWRSQPGADLIHGRCAIIDAEDGRQGVRSGSIRTLDEVLDLWDVWWRERNFVQPEVFWTRRLADRIGPFREELHYVMDYDYWLRALLAGAEVLSVDRELAGFRLHGAQKSGNARAAADELRRVVHPHIWDSRIAIEPAHRARLKADWLYDVTFSEAVNASLASGESRLLRWLRLVGTCARHPRLLASRGLRSRLAISLGAGKGACA